jgi:hypothetical protein
VNPSKLESILKVYPVNDMLVVNLQSEQAGTVSVYNVSGQEIYSQKFAGEHRKQLSNGFYIVKVTHKGELATRKVLIIE